MDIATGYLEIGGLSELDSDAMVAVIERMVTSEYYYKSVLSLMMTIS